MTYDLNDMITLFNQLTSKKLADYNLFSHMIELHYEKFKYLYYILKNLDLNTVSDITCVESDDKISVSIEPSKNSYTNDIIYIINEQKNLYKKREYFDIENR